MTKIEEFTDVRMPVCMMYTDVCESAYDDACMCAYLFSCNTLLVDSLFACVCQDFHTQPTCFHVCVRFLLVCFVRVKCCCCHLAHLKNGRRGKNQIGNTRSD
jgi:hypothetical protein